MEKENIPNHIVDYMECLERMVVWCKGRASAGDTDVRTLAYKFAENIIERSGVGLNG